MSHLSTSGPSKMAFEHLRNCFHCEDSKSGFFHLFQLCFHIAQGHILPQIAHVFRAIRLLAMTKPSGGVRSIAVGESLYQLTSHTLCFQFHENFITHFSPH